MYGSNPCSQSSSSPAPSLRMPPATDSRRPFRAPPDPWGAQIAYVGQDPIYENSGGCSQYKAPVNRAEGYPHSTWSTLPGGRSGREEETSPSAATFSLGYTSRADTLGAYPLHNPMSGVGSSASSSRGGSAAVASAGSTLDPWIMERTVPGDRWGYGDCGLNVRGSSGFPQGTSQRYQGDELGQRCQMVGCPELASYSADGRRPAEFCANHRTRAMHHVDYEDRMCREPGCGRPADVTRLSRSGGMDRLCFMHENSKPADMSPLRATCQVAGCSKAPRYGPKDMPFCSCPDHKRAGMYTVRRGKLLVATRDGHAFRPSGSVSNDEEEHAPPPLPPPLAPGVSSSPGSRRTAPLPEGDQEGRVSAMDSAMPGIDKVAVGAGPTGAKRTARNTVEATGATRTSGSAGNIRPPGSAGSARVATTEAAREKDKVIGVQRRSASSSRTGKNGREVPKIARKLCEIPGCQVQPSYGPAGTKRPRFCTGHKGPGMVALKNRPCLYPGCDTRPHYGISGGRAMYCVQHMKPGMVHILKEQMTKEKEVVTRKRNQSKKSRASQKRSSRDEAVKAQVGFVAEPRVDGAASKEDEDEEAGEGGNQGGGASAAGNGTAVEGDSCYEKAKKRKQTDRNAWCDGEIAREARENQGNGKGALEEGEDNGDEGHENREKRVQNESECKLVDGADGAETAAGESLGSDAGGERNSGDCKRYMAGGTEANGDHEGEQEENGVEEQGGSIPCGGDSAEGKEAYRKNRSFPKDRRRMSIQQYSESPSLCPGLPLASSSKSLGGGAGEGTVAASPRSTVSSLEGDARGPKKVRSSRLTETSGGAPSAEMRTVQTARECARAAADANGSGRRARAPSLKALEAAGLAEEEGAQWMSKERKEAEMRRLKEYKDQRRAAAEAGLSSGVVIEALAVAVDGAGAGSRGGGDGGESGAGSGDGGSAGSKQTWRKLSPEELRRQADEARLVLEKTEVQARTAASMEMLASLSERAAKEGEHGLVGAACAGGDTGAANRKSSLSTKNRKGGEDDEPSEDERMGGDSTVSKKPLLPARDSTGKWTRRTTSRVTKRTKRSREADMGVGDGEEGNVEDNDDPDFEEDHDGAGKGRNDRVSRGKKANKKSQRQAKRRNSKAKEGTDGEDSETPEVPVTCEFSTCSRRATFGVNGAVRYCKAHRLFGMHEITKRR